MIRGGSVVRSTAVGAEAVVFAADEVEVEMIIVDCPDSPTSLSGPPQAHPPTTIDANNAPPPRLNPDHLREFGCAHIIRSGTRRPSCNSFSSRFPVQDRVALLVDFNQR